MAKWENNRGGFVTDGDGFTISYQPVHNLVCGDHPDGETALIDEENGVRGDCLILNGDWRTQYEPLIDQGYNACKAFYDRMAPQHRSKWSEDTVYTPTTMEALEILTATLKI